MNKQCKEILLYLLENDNDVFDAIKKIISKCPNSLNESEDTRFNGSNCDELMNNTNICEIDQLKNTIKRLEDEKKNLLIEKHDIEKKHMDLSNEYNFFKTTAKKTSDDLKMMCVMYRDKLDEMEQNKKYLLEKVNKFEEYEREFKNLKNIYDKYCNLDENIFCSLERILNKTEVKSETAEVFFSYGIQEDNFIALWELISNNYQLYEKRGCLDDMREILLYFMKNIVEVSSKKYEMILPELGDGYDERYCTRTTTSNATGHITKIILPGLYNSKGIIKKTLVEVK